MKRYLICFCYKILCFFGRHKWNIIHVNENGNNHIGYVLLECRYCDHRTMSNSLFLYTRAILERKMFLTESTLTRFVIVEKCNSYTLRLDKLAKKRVAIEEIIMEVSSL